MIKRIWFWFDSENISKVKILGWGQKGWRKNLNRIFFILHASKVIFLQLNDSSIRNDQYRLNLKATWPVFDLYPATIAIKNDQKKLTWKLRQFFSPKHIDCRFPRRFQWLFHSELKLVGYFLWWVLKRWAVILAVI